MRTRKPAAGPARSTRSPGGVGAGWRAAAQAVILAAVDTIIDASWYRRPPDTPQRLTAGGLVCSVQDEQLLVALAREGEWPACIIPKGGVEPGETVEAAARREIAEETGFTRLTLLGKLGVLERLTFDRAHWTVTHVFAYLTVEQAATPHDRGAHPQPALWCRPGALPAAMLWPDQRRLIEQNHARLRRWVDRATGGSR